MDECTENIIFTGCFAPKREGLPHTIYVLLVANVDAEWMRHFRPPEARSPVHAACGQVVPKAVGGHAPHRVEVAVEGAESGPRPLVPQPQGRVLADKSGICNFLNNILVVGYLQHFTNKSLANNSTINLFSAYEYLTHSWR